MTGWRTIGEGLKNQWQRMHDGIPEQVARLRERTERDAPMLAAVIAHRRGDAAAIPALLRSATPLSDDDRETLAFLLEGGFDDPPRGPGAPPGLAKQVAGKVSYFVDEWQEICERNDVSTYGATDEMRAVATAFILDELGSLAAFVNAETVIGYIEKGKVTGRRAKVPRNST